MIRMWPAARLLTLLWLGIVVTGCYLVVVPACPTCPGTCPTLYPIALVFPVPGSTDVPVGIGQVLVRGGFTLNGTASVSLGPAAGPFVPELIATPATPLPAPIATPATVMGYPLAGAPVPVLAPHTTYTVNFTQAGVVTGCGPTSAFLGSFTTQ